MRPTTDVSEGAWREGTAVLRDRRARSEVCWRKFINSAKHYDADVLILGAT